MKKFLLFSLLFVSPLSAAIDRNQKIGPFATYSIYPNQSLQGAIDDLDPQGILDALEQGADPKTQGRNKATALDALLNLKALFISLRNFVPCVEAYIPVISRYINEVSLKGIKSNPKALSNMAKMISSPHAELPSKWM